MHMTKFESVWTKVRHSNCVKRFFEEIFEKTPDTKEEWDKGHSKSLMDDLKSTVNE